MQAVPRNLGFGRAEQVGLETRAASGKPRGGHHIASKRQARPARARRTTGSRSARQAVPG